VRRPPGLGPLRDIASTGHRDRLTPRTGHLSFRQGPRPTLHVWESGAYDGDGDPTVGTAFFGHVVALALNLEFDGMPDYNLQHPGLPLADLVVAQPTLAQ
jgi:hypothetical protein